MTLKQSVLSVCMCAALATVPAAFGAAKCIVPSPTPASNTWNFRHEADGIFKDFQWDAGVAKYHAEQLQSIAEHSELVSWASDVNELDQIRTEVNAMGQQMCRLEAIRRVVDPWQKKTIDRIAVTVRLLADNTQDATTFGNSHRQTLWVPTYQKYVNNMYSEAKSLSKSLDHAVDYAKTSTEYRALKKDVNAKSSS